MTIQWAEDAVRQLVAAHAYVAADNARAADRLLLQITQAVKVLGSHPQAGREGRVANTRELVIPNTPYIVAYRIESKNVVQILAVLQASRFAANRRSFDCAPARPAKAAGRKILRALRSG